MNNNTKVERRDWSGSGGGVREGIKTLKKFLVDNYEKKNWMNEN